DAQPVLRQRNRNGGRSAKRPFGHFSRLPRPLPRGGTRTRGQCAAPDSSRHRGSRAWHGRFRPQVACPRAPAYPASGNPDRHVAGIRRHHERASDHADDPPVRLGHPGREGLPADDGGRVASRRAVCARNRGRRPDAGNAAEPATPLMLTLKNVACSYGAEPVLRDVSFYLERGHIGCILGPSGCGKTTLLRCIAGFERVTNGEIVAAGVTLSTASRHLPAEQRRIGMVFQDYALLPHLTALENVE